MGILKGEIIIKISYLNNNKYYLKGIKLAESIRLSSCSGKNIYFVTKATDRLYNYNLIDKKYKPSERKIVRYEVNKLILENVK